MSNETKIKIPDIGDVADAEIIEIPISAGDHIETEDTLLVLETDKATMDVPAPFSGTVKTLLCNIGDKVAQGSPILVLETTAGKEPSADGEEPSADGEEPSADGEEPSADREEPSADREEPSADVEEHSASEKPSVDDESSAEQKSSDEQSSTEKEPSPPPVPDHPAINGISSKGVPYASPAIRRFARGLGVQLSEIQGTGSKGRILKEDVRLYVKYELSRPKANAASGAFNMPALPKVDFEKFGKTEKIALSKIQKISSVNLHRNWITIPHVTQQDEADITEMEAFRKSMKEEAASDGIRLTPLTFMMKAVVASLKAFPRFNASLAEDGENLILKHYYHIGVAVDTPDGLVVPVIKDVDKKTIYQLATELADVSEKARNKRLGVEAMQGNCFTISSLGGIGGTAFTPIVNWPDVAILGVSKSSMKPVWNGQEFKPRLMLPLSLSYDHRVIDGADGVRFITHLSKSLGDIRRLLL